MRADDGAGAAQPGIGSALDLPVFAGLDHDEAASFAEHARVVELAAGDVLFRQGDRGKSLYFLISGCMDVVAGEGEGEGGGGGGHPPHRLAALEPGAILGEIAVLTDAPRTATAVATADARLWELDDASFHAALDGSRQWALVLLRTIACVLAERLSTVDGRLLNLIATERDDATSGTGRVAELERLRSRLLSDWTF